jgi:hypothetical protein
MLAISNKLFVFKILPVTLYSSKILVGFIAQIFDSTRPGGRGERERRGKRGERGEGMSICWLTNSIHEGRRVRHIRARIDTPGTQP